MAVITLVSCKDGIEYTDTEVNVNYDVVCGKDTLHLEANTFLNERTRFKPTVYVVNNGETLVVRGVDSKGNTNGYGWEVDTHKRRHFATYEYPKCKVIVKEVKTKRIRVYETSRWNGDEIE